jgi:activating signal cointegrator complex subunit 3
VTQAAQLLDEYKMVRFNRDSGNLAVVSQGRVAAHYYIQAESVATFNEMLERTGSVNDAFLLRVICAATEFRNMKVRQEELSELASLHANACPMPIEGAGRNASGQAFITGPEDKAFILMQAYISRARINSFTLVSDTNYIASSAGRVARALFEMMLVGGSGLKARKLLRIAKSVDNQLWWFQTPLRQFGTELKEANYSGIELFHGGSGYDTFAAALSLLDMQANEVGELAKWRQGGERIQRFVRMLPLLDIDYKVQPLTSGLILLHVELTPTFEWHGRWHGGAQSFWLLIEDGSNGRIYHHENVRFTHKKLEPIHFDLKIPTFDSSPQYLIQVMSDSWVAVESVLPVPLQDIEMPREKTPWTRLQDLTPLPTSALNDPKYEQIYAKYGAFNPVQTQVFHVVYHTDTPIFLGAPTGSGTLLLLLLLLSSSLLEACLSSSMDNANCILTGCLLASDTQVKQSLQSWVFYE